MSEWGHSVITPSPHVRFASRAEIRPGGQSRLVVAFESVEEYAAQSRGADAGCLYGDPNAKHRRGRRADGERKTG